MNSGGKLTESNNLCHIFTEIYMAYVHRKLMSPWLPQLRKVVYFDNMSSHVKKLIFRALGWLRWLSV